MMDGVSWTTTRAQESFSRSRTASETLSRLASFIARAETKQHAPNKRQQGSHVTTYVCQECGEGFPYVTELFNHQEVKHMLPKPHRCPSCGQEFSLRSSLQLHKCCIQDSSLCDLCLGRSQLGSPCPACMTLTSDPGKLKDPHHQQPGLLDGSPYACALCGRGFSQKQALLHHQRAACCQPPSSSDVVHVSSLPGDSPPVSVGGLTLGPSSRPINRCQSCSKMFRTEAGLQRHKQSYHGKEPPMDPQGLKTKGDCTSEEGRKECNTKENGDLIEIPKSKMKLLDCRSCDMVFRSTSKLSLHRKEKHSREKSIGKEPRPVVCKRRRGGIYPCQVCGKVFFHHLSLRAHYRQHTASSFTTIQNKSQPVGRTTKDSEFSENPPNQVKASIAENRSVKAGPGRPRKVVRVENKVADPGRCGDPGGCRNPGRCRDLGRCRDPRGCREVPEEEEDREFPCPSCAEVFSEPSRLKEHVELHQSSVRKRLCSVCTDHMDTCKWPGSKRQRLYHCVPCQQGFSALDSFLEHCQEHLRVKVEEDRIIEGYTHQARKA